jgi:hypothetical protein
LAGLTEGLKSSSKLPFFLDSLSMSISNVLSGFMIKV